MSDINRPDAQPPRTILITWVALLVAAAFSVLSGAALIGATSWQERQQRNSITHKKITSTYSAAQQQKDLADVAHNISQARPFQFVFACIAAALLIFIALRVRDGRHWTRWTIVGVWVLISISGYGLVGFTALLLQGSDAPILLKVPTLIGALALIVAVIAVNMRPSVTFLNANKPVRADTAGTPAPGLRGLFAPRPSAPKPPPQPTPAKSATTEAPAKSAKPDAQRTKAKARTSAPVNPPAKSRGKSRGR